MRRAAHWLAVLATIAVAHVAQADDKQQCLTASDQGQQLRDDGKYRRAREAFATCSRDVCPALVRRDCVKWLADLEASSPSVVVSAKDDKSSDLVNVTVQVDGAPLVSKLDGKPTLVDPGPHVFHFEAAGFPPVEQHVVVHAGEKSRLLTVQFGTPSSSSPAPGPGATPPSASDTSGGTSPAEGTPPPGGETPPAAGSSSGTRISAWAFAGVALVAFGTEAYFGLSGLSDRSNLESDPCAKTSSCQQSSVDSIRTKFTVADIALGVGLVSAGLSAYLFLTSPRGDSAEPHTSAIDVTPLPGGAAMRLGGRF
jgi:hypothetical protein